MITQFRKIAGATVSALLLVLDGTTVRASDSGSCDLNTFDSSGNSCGSCCFPSAQGWTKYNTLTNFYFVGPNGTNTSSGGVPIMANTNHWTKLLISTCDSSNGTNLQTGIMIKNLYTGIQACQTNNCGKLTTNLVTMSASTNQAVYKAVIYYKGATLGTNVFIHVDWQYQN